MCAHLRFVARLSGRLALLGAFALAHGQEIPRDAAKIYALFCASCHGENLEGGQGGSLLTATWKHGDGGDAHLARMINEGAPDLGMPGFGAVLDAPRVHALTVFLRERSARAQDNATTYAQPADADTVVRSRAADFQVETVVSGLGIPWSLGFLPGGNFLIAEREGSLRLVRAGKLLPAPIADTPRVFARGQGGLMVVQAHPDYAQPGNGWLYLAFSDPSPSGHESMTAIVRGRIRDHAWVDEQTIYRAAPESYVGGGVHFGVRLVFDQGYLYFGIGDRGRQNEAQELSVPNGKIHRIYDDGRVPADNPFLATPGALPTIWSYGHRNPQGIVARPGTTGEALQIWETEHGPRGGDELNLIKRGANFGWPIISYGMNYDGTPVTGLTACAGSEQPVVRWTPSIAVCGLDFYHADAFPAWRGNLFVGALQQQEVRRLVLEGDTVKEQEVLFRGIGRVRAVQTGPDGYLYVCLEGPGRVVRLVPAAQ